MTSTSRTRLVLTLICVIVVTMTSAPALAGTLVTGLSTDGSIGLPFDDGSIRLPFDDGSIRHDWNITINSSGQSVTIRWAAPTAYADRPGVVYHVFRSPSVEDLFMMKNRLTEFGISHPSFEDTASPGSYYFAVRATLTDGTILSTSKPVLADVGKAATTQTPPTTSTPATQPSVPPNSVPESNGTGNFPTYLAIDGITGDIAVGGFSGGVDILAYQWMRSTPQPTGASPSQTLTIEKKIDSASAPLAIAYHTGQLIPTATLTACQWDHFGNDNPFYRIILTNVRVVGYTIEQNHFNPSFPASETIQFAFDGFTAQYRHMTGLSGDSTPRDWVTMVYDQGLVTPPPPPEVTSASSDQTPNGADRVPTGTYLTMAGIPGPAMSLYYAIKYPMNLMDYHLGGSKGADGRITKQLTFTKNLDYASVRLATACLSGQSVAKAVLEVAKPSALHIEQVFYRVTLTEVKVSSITQVKENDQYHENVTLSYAGIKIEYRFIGSNATGPWITVATP